MTNEELAERAQNGDNIALIDLWEQSQRLIYMLLYRFCTSHSAALEERGYTAEDVKQEGYFIFLRTVRAYDGRFAFSSYLNHTILNYFFGAGGLWRKKDALISASSLDAPFDSSDEESMTLADILSDPDDLIEESTEKIYRDKLLADIRGAIEALEDSEKLVIFEKWRGCSPAETAQKHDMPLPDVRKLICSALCKLRLDKRIRAYYNTERGVSSLAYASSLTSWKHHDFTSSTEREVFKRNK